MGISVGALKRVGKLTKKRIFILISISLLTLLSLPVVAYFILRSPDAQAKILKSLKDPLAQQGVTLDSTSISVDLLAGVNFEKLVISINRPPLIKANLAIDHMRFSYSFWSLLKRRVELQEAEINGLTGQIVASLLPAEAVKEEPAQTLAQLLGMLRSPPVMVSMPSITIKNTKIKLTLEQGPSHTEVDLKQADIQISGAINPSGVDFDLTAGLGVGLAMRSDGVVGDAQKVGRVPPSNIRVADVRVREVIKLHVDAPPGQLNWRLDINTEPLKISGLKVDIGDKTTDQMHLELLTLNMKPATVHIERSGEISDLDPMSAVVGRLKGASLTTLDFSQLAFETMEFATGNQLNAAVGKLQLSNEVSFLLAKDNNPLKHDWTISQTLQVQGIQLIQRAQPPAASKVVMGAAAKKKVVKEPAVKAKPMTLNLANARIVLDSKANQGPGTLSLKVNLDQIKTDFLAAPLSVEKSVQLAFNLIEQTWKGHLEVKLNRESFLTWTGSGKDQKQVLTQQSNIDISVPKSLAAIHKGLQGLGAAGWPKISVELRNAITHPLPWSEFKGEGWPTLGSDTAILVKVTPTISIFPKGSPSFAGVKADIKVHLPARPSGSDTSTVGTVMDIEVRNLGHEALTQKVDAVVSTDASVNISKKISGNLKVGAALNKMKILSLDTTWTDNVKILGIDNRLIAEIKPALLSLLVAAKTAPPLGVIRIHGHHTVDVHHGEANILSIKKFDPDKSKIAAKITETIEQDAKGVDNVKLKLERPFDLAADVVLANGQVNLLAKVKAPKIVSPEAAIIHGLTVDIESFVSDLAAMKNITFGVHGAAEKIEALIKDKAGEQKDKIIRDFRFAAAGQVKNKTKIILSNISAGLQDEIVKFAGSGEFLAEGRGQLDAKLTSKLSPSTQFISGSGQFEMPIKFLLLSKDSFSVEMSPTFTDYSLAVGDLSLKNLNGKVNISEELRKDAESKIRFQYLKTQSPFARVDYENLSPFIGEKNQMGFESLTWRHLVVGPLIASFEIQQNLVVLNDLKVDLLGGSALGRFFLDLDPKIPKVGFLGRFSAIIPEMIKAPELRTPQKDWTTMAGRAAVVFEIRKRLTTGRIDMTTLGKQQLMSLLDVLDPNGADEQIGMARTALRAAYPKFVNMDFGQGLMDLTVGLGGVVTTDMSIRSIPLSNMINSNAGEALSKVEGLLN